MEWYSVNRRKFIQGSVIAGLGLTSADFAWAEDKSPNEKVNFACIGVGGKGGSDTADAARTGNVVAICDVDENTLRAAQQRYPNAKPFTDYRKMYEEFGHSFDAVTVSTPDHHHGPAALMAMKMGKHCFCQKPLTHSLWEAREMAKVAKDKKVATQMGNQGTSDNSMRLNAYRVKAGQLGSVKEVHVWTNRPIWPQGMTSRPPEETPPATLNWDVWLGPAPIRPYGKGYHDFKWRGWWDFGTGALGDMACHIMNLPYMALDLRNPLSVEAQTSGHNKDAYPSWSIIKYEFAGNKERGPVTLYWYDGGKLPPADLLPSDIKLNSGGSIMIGDKGKLYTANDYGGGGKWIGVEPTDVDYPKAINHFEEYVKAIKTGQPATSSFPEYAGGLTETVLLGNLSVWADGKKIEWDAKKLKAKNAPEVAEIIKPHFREGWKP